MLGRFQNVARGLAMERGANVTSTDVLGTLLDWCRTKIEKLPQGTPATECVRNTSLGSSAASCPRPCIKQGTSTLPGNDPSAPNGRMFDETVKWTDGSPYCPEFGPLVAHDAVMTDLQKWKGDNRPDVVLSEPPKILQLLSFFTLYCPVHGHNGVVRVSGIRYSRQIVILTLHCRRGCQWVWHSSKPENTKLSSRVTGQMYHAALSCGMGYTTLNDFCLTLGMRGVHKTSFYMFSRGMYGFNGGWCDVAQRTTEKDMTEAVERVRKEYSNITVLLDGRYDSSCDATQCTVTVMHYETRLILGVETIRKRPGESS
ncbi:hypothetical protein CBR_g30085 [Chara braunii]|uniref:Mutator-like transposase domain-containing protein n=1 Tax=Chara braunii TaxID=69332 RepID=A0A388LBY9_CHABU|nr:hypothetical protein CBR_g30085 [Chara braunii]|eukprot:GBG79821.1 hypothetical protein CBR_g30085 [Chara braunii]